MELAKNLTAEEQANDLIRLHYIENYASFALYDIGNAKKNALVTVKTVIKTYRNLHKKLVLGELVQGDVEETQTFKYWMKVIKFINDYTITETLTHES